MFGWCKKKTDRVALRTFGGELLIREVEWKGGRAYASAYLPHAAGRLLPGGKVDGPIYVVGWYPMSYDMVWLYDEPEKVEPVEIAPEPESLLVGAPALDEEYVRWIVQDELMKPKAPTVTVTATGPVDRKAVRKAAAAVSKSRNR